MTRLRWMLLAGAGRGGPGLDGRSPAHAQQVDPTLNRFFYYPYYYFPANYWPSQGPQWPEPHGRTVHAAAGLHGLPAVQRAALALRVPHAAEATTAASISGSTSSER